MRFPLVLCLFASLTSYGQNTFSEKLADHEKQFAAAGLLHLPEAFMRFMDTASAVSFRGGQWRKMKADYEGKKADSSRLVWGPALAISSADGSLGLTAGSWTWQAGSKQSVASAGYFVTLWRQGKFVLDCGYALDSLLMHPDIHAWRRFPRLIDLAVSARSPAVMPLPAATDQASWQAKDLVLQPLTKGGGDLPTFSIGFGAHCSVFVPREAVESSLPVNALRMLEVEAGARNRVYLGGWQSKDGTLLALYGHMETGKGRKLGFFRAYTQNILGQMQLALSSYFD